MKTINFFMFSVVASVAMGTAACGGSDPSAEEALAPQGEESEEAISANGSIRVYEKDDGKTVSVKTGQNIYLYLDSNPTTGYGWKVTSTDRTFGYPTSTFLPSGSGAVGAGGRERFKWSTKSPLSLEGKHTVELSYQRSWETTPIKKVTFTFDVQSGNVSTTDLKITDSDNGKSFTVKSGPAIVVSLPANGTTGYEWSVTATDRTIGYPHYEYKPSQPINIGSGGTAVFTWETGGSWVPYGTHNIVLSYARGAGTPAKTFKFTVTVSR